MLPPKVWNFIKNIQDVRLSPREALEYFDKAIPSIVNRIAEKPNNGRFITHLDLNFLLRSKVIYDDGKLMVNPEELRLAIDEPFVQHINEALKNTRFRVTSITLHNDIMTIYFNRQNAYNVINAADKGSMAFGSSILPSGSFKYNKVKD